MRLGSRLGEATTVTRVALAVFVALRALTIAVADLPTIMPDEYGSWAIATRLALGDGLVSMQDMPSYPLVPGLALVPLHWMPVGPATAYRLALVLSSVAAFVAADLVRRAVRSLRPDEPLLAATAFAVVLLSPALLTTTSFTWAEPAVLLCWATMCWAAVEITRRDELDGALAPLLAGSIAAGAAPFVHGRLMAAPAIWAVLLVAVAWRSTGAPARRRAAAGVAVTLVVALLLSRLDALVKASLWTDAIGHDTGALRGSAASPEVWWTVLCVAIGQLWYAVAASFGLAAFGVLGCVAAIRGRHGATARLVAGFVAALAASNLALSTIAMSSGTFRAATTGSTGGVDTRLRWDHLVYGRYNDAAIVVLSVVGLFWLWSERRRVMATAAVVVAFLVASVSLVLVRAAQLPLVGQVDVNVAGVTMFDAGAGAAALVIGTLSGAITTGAVALGARRGRPQLAGVVVVLLCLAVIPAGLRTAAQQRSLSTPDVAGPVGEASPDHPVAVIATDTASLPFLRLGAFGVQHQLVHAGWTFEFAGSPSEELARTAEDRAEVGLVVLDAGDHPGPGWSEVMEFEGSALWRRD